MSKKPKKISTLLRDAAKWIDEHGLAKESFWKHRNGRVLRYQAFDEGLQLAREKGCKACARGALYIADTPELHVSERERRHSQAIRYLERAVTNGYYIAAWNDEPERTKDEVVQALKEAAKAARKDGK